MAVAGNFGSVGAGKARLLKMIRNQRLGIDAGGRNEVRGDQSEDRRAGATAAARVGARLAPSTDSRYEASAQAEDELLA